MNRAAAETGLPTPADAGHEGAGHGIKTPTKQPADGKQLSIANRSVNQNDGYATELQDICRDPRWSLPPIAVGNDRKRASVDGDELRLGYVPAHGSY